MFAEILYKIHEAYKDSTAVELFPMPANGRKWELHFFFLTNQFQDEVPGGPYFDDDGEGKVGGRPGIPCLRANMPDDLRAFYANVALGNEGGTGQNAASTPPPTGPHPHLWIRGWIHEFVHTLGPADAPPNFLNDPVDPWEKYFYGNLNIICQHLPAASFMVTAGYDTIDGTFRGIPPLADPWLATLPLNTGDHPDNPVTIDFTTTSYRNQKIHDVSTGGQMYRYDLGPYDFNAERQDQDEYFLIAYHGGHGLDNQPGYVSPGEQPCVPSQGLAIWHCIGESMFDLESAHGLYDYADKNVEVFVPHWENGALTADPIQGLDNYDGRRTNSGIKRRDWAIHDGHESDFFQLSDNANLHTPEFAWWTNPSSLGYVDDTTEPVVRRRQQTEANPMVVRIKGVSPVDSSLIVDFLHAPSDSILTVPPAQGIAVGATTTWNWATTFPTSDVTTVAAVFSPNGGHDYTDTLATANYAAGSLDLMFAEPQGTDHERLRFAFHNSIMPERVGYYDVPEEFAVTGGCPQVYEHLVFPDGGDALLTGNATVRWTNHFEADFKRIDLEYSHDLGATWAPWTTLLPGGSPSWSVDADGYNTTTPAVPAAMVGPSVMLRLTTYYDPGGGCAVVEASDVSEAPFAVVPASVRLDPLPVTQTDLDYEGEPYGTTVLDVNDDGMADLFVTMQGSWGASDVQCELYMSDGQPEDAISFNPEAQYLFGGTVPEVGYLAVAAADINEDGTDDLFLCHPDTPGLYVTNAAGQWVDVSDDPTWFGTADDQDKLHGSRAATWVDYDHDGDLDLHIGRTGDGRTDALLRNNDVENGLGEPEFECVLTEAWIDSSSSGTFDALWVDYDDDGFWDVVKNTGGHAPFFYRETAAGIYEFTTTGTPSLSVYGGFSELEFVDYDGDSDLDLVGSGRGRLYGSCNQDSTWFNMTPSPFFEGGFSLGLATGDLDCDGHADLLVPSADAAQPWVGLNLTDDSRFDSPWLFSSEGLGIPSAAGESKAMALADFNNDGDLDVFLGFPGDRMDGRILQTKAGDGSEASDGHWLKIRLRGIEDNRDGIGAQVKVFVAGTGECLGSQYVSGEGDRSGQPGHELHFGLGDVNSPVGILVIWPLGRRQSVSLQPNELDQRLLIEQTMSYGIHPADISFTTVFEPGNFIWEFEWYTDHCTSWDADRVVVTDVDNKLGQDYDLEYGDSGVEVSTEYVVDALGRRFRHRLTLNPAPCVGRATFHYTVSSDRHEWNMGPAISSTQIGQMPKTCPQNF